jgi:hypothetical protein
MTALQKSYMKNEAYLRSVVGSILLMSDELFGPIKMVMQEQFP